jgi:hypothetical protein
MPWSRTFGAGTTELAVEESAPRRLAVAFAELAMAV